MEEMKLTSSAFVDGETIPSKYTCDAENISPELIIENVPENARSLVLMMEDPDVPAYIREDGMWDHWVVFNIPVEIKVIPESEEPPGMQGLTTSNELGYNGPCPPDKEHRYFFMLYALDSEINEQEGATKEAIKMAMKHHIIAKAELVGKYERNKK